VSADFPGGEALHGVEPGASGMLRVETVFRVADELHGQTVAAKMIDRAHEIANLPECQCDVDVSVEWVRPDGRTDPRGAPTGGVPPVGHPTER
jgi:hypothetical protein